MAYTPFLESLGSSVYGDTPLSRRKLCGYVFLFFSVFFPFFSVLSDTGEVEAVCDVVDDARAARASCGGSASTLVGAASGAARTAVGACFGFAALGAAACVAGGCCEPVLTATSTAVPSSAVVPTPESCSIP